MSDTAYAAEQQRGGAIAERAMTQRKARALVHQGPQARLTAHYQGLLDASQRVAALQRRASAANATPSAQVPVQRTTVAFPTAGMDDYDDILAQAQQFHAAHGTGALHDSEGGHTHGDATEDTHFDVFAHGNQDQVGDFTSASALKGELSRLAAQLNMDAVYSVTLHSCESGSEHPRTHREFGDLLHEAYRDDFEYVDVHGYTGETVTDHTGATRVLKEGRTIEQYKIAARTAPNRQALDEAFLEPVGTGKVTFGGRTLDMYSPSDEDVSAEQRIYDPEAIREYRVNETREQLHYIRDQRDDEPSGADDREVFSGT